MNPLIPAERQLPEGRLTLSQAFLVPDSRKTWDRSAYQTLMSCFAYVDPAEREVFRLDAQALSKEEFFGTRYWRIVSSVVLQRAAGCRLCLHSGPLTVRPTSDEIRGKEYSATDQLEALCEICVLDRENRVTDEQRAIIEHRRKQAWMKRNTLAGNDQ